VDEEERQASERDYTERQECYDRLTNRAFIGERFVDVRFDNLNRDAFNAEAIASLEQYIESIDAYVRDGYAVGIMGTVGVGKTAICVAFLKAVRAKKKTVAIINTFDFFDAIKAGFDKDERYGIMAALKAVDILILDDIGRGKQSEWRNEMLYALINDRWVGKRATFFNSNLESRASLEDFLGDAGIVDRLFLTAESEKDRKAGRRPHMRVFLMKGDSRR
jgi:DNA replication protein DnaC